MARLLIMKQFFNSSTQEFVILKRRGCAFLYHDLSFRIFLEPTIIKRLQHATKNAVFINTILKVTKTTFMEQYQSILHQIWHLNKKILSGCSLPDHICKTRLPREAIILLCNNKLMRGMCLLRFQQAWSLYTLSSSTINSSLCYEPTLRCSFSESTFSLSCIFTHCNII